MRGLQNPIIFGPFIAVVFLFQSFEPKLYGQIHEEIYRFSDDVSQTGTNPKHGLVQGSDGNFYGATVDGGAEGLGTVFKMTSEGAVTKITDFTGNSEMSSKPETFGNVTPITINRFQSASPSPSQITVPPSVGEVGRIRVTLHRFSHPDPFYCRLLLVAPNGKSCLLMSRNDRVGAASDVTFSFDDEAIIPFGREKAGDNVGQILNQYVYRPLAFDTGRKFAFPAPEGPYANTLSVFEGDPGAGTWSLYVLDEKDFPTTSGYPGTLAEGWSLRITHSGNKGRGAHPSALVEGSDGNLYGTTSDGGALGNGTIFKVNSSGVLETLADLPGEISSTLRFENDTPVAVEYFDAADPYPSTIEVPPGVGAVDGLRVTLNGFTHPFPGDTRFLLVSPSGASCLLMSRVGGIGGVTDATLTFDDNAGTEITDPIVSRTYRPTANVSSAGTDMKAPAPPAPYGETLSVFDGEPSSGVWSLYAIDERGDAFGTLRTLAGGWSLDFTPRTNVSGSKSSLVQGSDGKFLGTSSAGGSEGDGAVFRFAPGGQVETLVNFTGNGVAHKGSEPLAALIEGGDGKFYGTTSSGGTDGFGTLFRFTPGEAVETLVNFTGNGGANRGAAPRGALFMGGDGKLYGTTSSGGSGGFGTVFRLTPGEAVEPLVDFTGNGAANKGAQPMAGLAIGGDGLFHGTTFAGGAGNLGTAFRLSPGSDVETLAEFASPNGGPQAPLTLGTDGLPYGTTTAGGGSLFRLVVPEAPKVIAQESRFVGPFDIEVKALIDVGGAPASLVLELENFGHVDEIPIASNITGISWQSLGTVLTELGEGTSFAYRFRATNSEGTAFSNWESFSTCYEHTAGGCFPGFGPAMLGSILVNVEPAGVGGWRFEGEKEWRGAGTLARGFASGERLVHFRPVPGYLQPVSETVRLVGGRTTTIGGTYFQTTAPGNGGITITIHPSTIAATSLPSADRAQWRILGEDDSAWRDSRLEFLGLAPGNYLVECKPVAGRNTPEPLPVNVPACNSTRLSVIYHEADTTAGVAASRDFDPFTLDDPTQPHAFVGQIRTNDGSGSGFLVKSRVVATAAQVIFDERTLSGLTEVQWLFQRDAGTYEPKPLIPRGTYILSGYADARLFATPGSFDNNSRNLDVGVLYFLDDDAGRGAFTPVLQSELSVNEHLTSGENKILVGYPVNGVPPTERGRLHATNPSDVSFASSFGMVYESTDIRSGYGSEGGPLCVETPDGFRPAAIHLGGSTATHVRAIDPDVIALFVWADNTANNRDGNPPSGGPTKTGIDEAITTVTPGSIKVTIEPTAAREAGAGWQMVPETTFRQSGSQRTGLIPGDYNLGFRTVSGFEAPGIQTVSVASGEIAAVSVTYQVSLSPLEIWRQDNFETTENSGDAADGADPDKDGRTNIEEYVAGTIPNDGGDFLELTEPVKSGGTFEATFAGKAARIYKLQRNVTLSGEWMTVAMTGSLAEDGEVTLTDTSAPTGNAYYRVEVKLGP